MTGHVEGHGNARRMAEWPLAAVYFMLAPLFRRTSHLLANGYFAFRAGRALKGREFDVCIAHDSYALGAAARIARRCNAALVYDAVEVPLLLHRSGRHLANNLAAPIVKLINEVMEPRLIEGCDLVITNSPEHARWHGEHYRLRVPPVLVPNARPRADFARSEAIRRDAGLAPGDRLLLWIGNGNVGYGLEETLAALRLLPAHVHLGVLGFLHPGYLPQFERRVAELGLGPRVHVLPPVNWEEVPVHASGADLGLITLQRRVLNMALAWPNRFFDCVAARLPVAASQLPAVVEAVERYGIGAVFDEQRPEDMARVITEMLGDEAQSRCRAALPRAATDLCWERAAPPLVSAVEALRPGKRPLRIAILARKNIWRTRRVTRIAAALRAAGHALTVVSPFPPALSGDGVEYLLADDGRGVARRFPQVARRLRAAEQSGAAEPGRARHA